MSATNDLMLQPTLLHAVVFALPECFRGSEDEYGTQGSPRT